jgi:predicted hydrocarbon binding protein
LAAKGLSQDKRNEDGLSARAHPGKLEDFFSLDFRTGSIVNRLTEERVQVIPTLRWKKLRDDWAREFHEEEASRIVAHMASTLGAAIASEMMKNLGDPVVLVKNISDLSAAAGWGVIAMTGDTQFGARLEVTVTNCVFCDKEDLDDSPQCDFLVGAFKGMADLIYGTPHRVREVSCAAMGHAICQFEVEECHDPSLCSSCRNLKYCKLSELMVER